MRLAVARREADNLAGCKRQDRLALCRQFLQKTEIGQKGSCAISAVATIGEGRKRRGRPPSKKQKPAASEGAAKPLPQSGSVQLQTRREASSSLQEGSFSLVKSQVLQLPSSIPGRNCPLQLPELEWLNSFKLTQTSILRPDSQLGVGSKNKSPGLLQLVPSAGM